MSYRILIADDERLSLSILKELLSREGHIVVGVATNGVELIRFARELEPDLIITDIVMPEINGVDAAMQIYADRPVPIIVLSAFADQQLDEQGFPDEILNVLFKPANLSQLKVAIRLAMRRHEQVLELVKKVQETEKELENRKLIERAKEILMDSARLTGQEAYNKIRTTARNKNKKVVEIAKSILEAHELLKSGD